MGDFSILFTFTETGYRNRLQSSKERLILELSLPLYHIKEPLMKSTNHAVFNVIFRFVENYVSPIAGRISSQRHVMAIRDGFISAMPFMIVGFVSVGICLPPFSPDTTWGFAGPGWIWLSSLKGRS